MKHLFSKIFKRIFASVPLSLLICGCMSENISSLTSDDTTHITSCRDMAVSYGMIVPSSIEFNLNSYRVSNALPTDVNLYFDADILIGIFCNRSDFDSYYDEYKTLTIVVDENNTIVNYSDEPVFIYSLKNYDIANYIILVGNIYLEGIDCKEDNSVSHGEDRRLYERI